jgi:hypothetical protein
MVRPTAEFVPFVSAKTDFDRFKSIGHNRMKYSQAVEMFGYCRITNI